MNADTLTQLTNDSHTQDQLCQPVSAGINIGEVFFFFLGPAS